MVSNCSTDKCALDICFEVKFQNPRRGAYEELCADREYPFHEREFKSTDGSDNSLQNNRLDFLITCAIPACLKEKLEGGDYCDERK